MRGIDIDEVTLELYSVAALYLLELFFHAVIGGDRVVVGILPVHVRICAYGVEVGYIINVPVDPSVVLVPVEVYGAVECGDLSPRKPEVYGGELICEGIAVIIPGADDEGIYGIVESIGYLDTVAVYLLCDAALRLCLNGLGQTCERPARSV